MKALLEDKHVFLVGGPGGVGKTTLAAALGIELARRGHRTIVLTVDPARRLAQALGFESFGSEVQRVTLPNAPDATLFATMLDTQRYFDRVVEKFATNPGQRERILKHPLWRVTIDNLGGTHEYAAMERLLEFATDPKWDRVVVDTPPTQNAVDLLSAPQRLADFMDNSVLKWFQGSEKKYLQLFRTGTRIAMKLLQTILGGEFLENLGNFLTELRGMDAGFRQRNLEVMELLKSQRTAFLLVSYPSEVRYLESLAFAATLREKQIPLAAAILNRLEPAVPAPPHLAGPAGPAVDATLEFLANVHREEETWIGKFAEALPNVPILRIDRQAGALHDLVTLSALGQRLAE